MKASILNNIIVICTILFMVTLQLYVVEFNTGKCQNNGESKYRFCAT